MCLGHQRCLGARAQMCALGQDQKSVCRLRSQDSDLGHGSSCSSARLFMQMFSCAVLWPFGAAFCTHMLREAAGPQPKGATGLRFTKALCITATSASSHHTQVQRVLSL